MDRETENRLVRDLRAGSAAAFDAVYDGLRARVYSFLARLSRRRDVAEDLAEETWLRLVANAPRLDPDTRLAPWLFTVARNLYYSYCRSRLLEEASASEIGWMWPSPARQPSPFDEAAAGELERRIGRALGALATRDREVLLLVGVEGLTPAEAATVCGVTPEALRQRLSRARERLARAMDEAPGPMSRCRDEALT
jgi:RNA polymerase sigma-70 factor (ECF subfamily)